jgi:prepilin-type N-terminal cleavage/methylation domain-containing protein
MSSRDTQPVSLRAEHGFTLIEMLVTLIIGLVVSLAAFSILQFTTDDVSRITARAHVDQTGRVALEKIILQLHSACVAVTINPILTKSTGNTVRFVSETSPLNKAQEPISSLSTVHLHEITYNESTGNLTEKSRLSTGTTPEFIFNEHETPEPTAHLLLTGVRQTEVLNETTKKVEKLPIFRYYRYYNSNDSQIKLGEAELGEIDPGTNNEGMNSAELEKESVEGKTKITGAEKVAKVTMSFTLTPEGHESIIAKGYQPIALEDSAILRLTPSSEEASNTNLPCAQI